MRRTFPLAVLCLAASLGAQEPSTLSDPLHRPLDEILDVNVRDGFVYYNALKSSRVKLDRYVASLGAVSSGELSAWPRERQAAFWLNAYNAFVLRTVIDHYPIRGKASQYPASSIRQIPGAFERRTFRAGGREVTLDGLERDVLAGFNDPRVFLALGRGAIGGGRLRSEAFAGTDLEDQLAEVAAESVTRKEIARLDTSAGVLSLSPIFSWREAPFVAAFADKADVAYAARSPIERAALALLEPHVLFTEREYLRRNSFTVSFHEFDWRLNDLTGGRRD
ncbi:MAG: DUF547 domain-containing protein [Acidobacteria bacterium]|nr:DUF547 domain-containing protein [Acidobacteriota bacterium]